MPFLGEGGCALAMQINKKIHVFGEHFSEEMTMDAVGWYTIQVHNQYVENLHADDMQEREAWDASCLERRTSQKYSYINPSTQTDYQLWYYSCCRFSSPATLLQWYSSTWKKFLIAP